MSFSILSGKKLHISLHALAWALILILPVYLLNTSSGFDRGFQFRMYFYLIAYVILFYLNFFVLVPYFFFKKKKKLYFLSAIAAIGFLYTVTEAANRFMAPPPRDPFEQKVDRLMEEFKRRPPAKNMHVFSYLFNAILVSGFSFGLKLSERYLKNEKEMKEMERERLNSELAFLKSQISPHFFFNTLNNIYSLIQINTDDAQSAVLKLSKLMRYLLYESEQGNTQLSREINFMQNYIDLMRLRINDKVEMKVTFPERYDDIAIPPLLFISLIENAFKHGISYRDKSFIHIELQTFSDEIRFVCVNSIGSPTEEAQALGSGIGLENIRKRLNLLYPQRHALTINQYEDRFEVQLSIKQPSIHTT
jgi:two-component sensor histidine kinase